MFYTILIAFLSNYTARVIAWFETEPRSSASDLAKSYVQNPRFDP